MRYTENFLSLVIDSYLTCALWVSEDELNDNYSIEDIDTVSLNKANEDCIAFLDSAPDNNIEPSQIGHDFLLTRNGHGAGFWDRGNGQLGEDLTKLCKDMGEVFVYLSDDNKVVID